MQWCQVGVWTTLWRDGKPDLRDLHVHDFEHPDSAVRLEALIALHALYVTVSEHYEAELWAAHEKLTGKYQAGLAACSKRSPTLTPDEIYARTQDRSWWPEDYLAEEGRRYGS